MGTRATPPAAMAAMVVKGLAAIQTEALAAAPKTVLAPLLAAAPITVLAAVLAAAPAFSGCRATTSDALEVSLHVTAGEAEGVEVPVHAALKLPPPYDAMPAGEIAVVLKEQGGEGRTAVGQVAGDPGGERQLWWILPEAEPGAWSTWTATFSRSAEGVTEGFAWQENEEGCTDLLFDGRKVIRYMHAFDPFTPERLHETYKPYHHVFDPDGERLLTKGPGGLYTHHRGLFIGWNRLKFGDQEYDFWHMKEVVQMHEEVLAEEAGPVLARARYRIRWNDPVSEPVILEEREITVFSQPETGNLLLEFASRLTPPRGDVVLDGDAEHAGFQYRPHNDVAEGPEEVKARYLFHEEGIDPTKDRDLPWAALSFGLNGERYVVQYMNHPDNPGPAVYSAYRDYGRFGSFFVKELKQGETLDLKYRINVEERDDMPGREEMSKRYNAFAHPPKVKAW